MWSTTVFARGGLRCLFGMYTLMIGNWSFFGVYISVASLRNFTDFESMFLFRYSAEFRYQKYELSEIHQTSKDSPLVDYQTLYTWLPRIVHIGTPGQRY